MPISLYIHFALVRTTPPTHVRQKYARGIVALFPYLADPQAENGYVSTNLKVL